MKTYECPQCGKEIDFDLYVAKLNDLLVFKEIGCYHCRKPISLHLELKGVG